MREPVNAFSFPAVPCTSSRGKGTAHFAWLRLFGQHRREAIKHSFEPQVEAVLEVVGIVRRLGVEDDTG